MIPHSRCMRAKYVHRTHAGNVHMHTRTVIFFVLLYIIAKYIEERGVIFIHFHVSA